MQKKLKMKKKENSTLKRKIELMQLQEKGTVQVAIKLNQSTMSN